jgi:hypothetical protein
MDLEVVLEQNALSVEEEVVKIGIVLQGVERATNDVDQADPEPVKGEIPLPVPVGVGHDVSPARPGGRRVRHEDSGGRSGEMARCRRTILFDEFDIVDECEVLAGVGAGGVMDPDPVTAALPVEFAIVDLVEDHPFGGIGISPA